MRKLTAILVLVGVIFGGLYTFYWFKKSDDFKQIFEQAVTQLNDKVKTQFGADITAIHYDSVTVSGFPFSIQINMNKPVITVPVSGIMKQLLHKTPVTPENVAIEVSYSDKIALSTNVLGNYFTAIYSGTSTIKPIVNNQPGKVISTDSASPFACHLSVHNPDNFPWNVPAAFNDMDSFLTAFRSADCAVSGSVSTLGDTGAVLTTMDGFSISGSREILDSMNQKIKFLLSMQNIKATSDYDDLAKYYFNLFSDLTGTPPNQRNNDWSVSLFGAQNTKIDVSYEGPVDRKYLTDPSVNIRFDINALNSKNELRDSNTEMHLLSAVHGDARDSSLIIHSSFEAGEPFERLLKKSIVDAIAQLNTAPPAAGADRKMLELATAGKPEDIAALVIPQFHDIGKISFDTDIAIKGSKDKIPLTNDEVTVNALDLTTSQAGLKIKGAGKTNSGQMGTADAVALCVQCDTLVDRLGSYAIGIDSLMAKTRPNQTAYVTRPLIEGIKQFLHALNDPANKELKDVSIHIVMDDKGNMTVSGKQVMEVMGLFSTSIGQYLQPQKPMPAVVVPAPAPATQPVHIPVKPTK